MSKKVTKEIKKEENYKDRLIALKITMEKLKNQIKNTPFEVYLTPELLQLKVTSDAAWKEFLLSASCEPSNAKVISDILKNKKLLFPKDVHLYLTELFKYAIKIQNCHSPLTKKLFDPSFQQNLFFMVQCFYCCTNVETIIEVQYKDNLKPKPVWVYWCLRFYMLKKKIEDVAPEDVDFIENILKNDECFRDFLSITCYTPSG